MSVVNFRKLSFDGWETTLNPEILSLLSLLKFRRTKDDFTYNISDEHFAISKFLDEIVNSGTDQRWAVATKNISIKVSRTYYCSGRRKEKDKEVGLRVDATT